MVFFTCNHCGESVKKPSVEKHYNTKCRGAPKSISCMDCQKDFQDNYVEHVKCISELEKYSGKDFVPRESANSGAKKQEGWVETVRAVLDSTEYDLSKPTRQAFEMLQKYDNVPRKKAKFLNFVTNSVRIPRKTVEEVWNILEKEQDKLKQAKQKQLEAAKMQKQTKENKESGHVDGDQKLQGAVDVGNESETVGKTKKDKKKQKAQVVENESDEVSKGKKRKATVEDEAANGFDNSSKKKKKKQATSEEVTKNGDLNKMDENVAKKNSGEEGQENGLKPYLNKTEKKQKKSKSLATESVGLLVPETDDVTEIKKQKKRAAQNDESAGLHTPTKKSKLNGEIQNGSSVDDTENYTFSWDLEFSNIMSKYDEGLSVEKLKKKILKKYKTKFDAELTERQQLGFDKKFNKKLKKNNLFKLEGETVKPVS